MDIYKYLVIVKGEDKTSDVLSYSYEGNYIKLKFAGSEKKYKYLKSDFLFFKDPQQEDINKFKIIWNKLYVYNAIKLLNFGDYYRLFFTDNTSVVIPVCDLQIIEDKINEQLSTDKFEYYKEISKVIGIKTDDDNSLLFYEYEKVNYINRDTALYKYLNPKSKINTLSENANDIIFPFGTNKSQFYAVENAMTSQISIIEGPPGTGKTQTILNIIANIIKNNQTVAVVSNNNDATNNVYEKLKKYNLDYLCARLGRKDNWDKFIECQTGKYPEFEEKNVNILDLKNQIRSLNGDVKQIFKIRNDNADLKNELSEVLLQYEYYKKHKSKISKGMPKIRKLDNLTPDIIMKLKVEFEELSKVNLPFRIKSQLIFGIGDSEFYNRTNQDIINGYNELFYFVKSNFLRRKIQSNNKKLIELGENKIDLLIDKSFLVLNEYLSSRYKSKEDRKIFSFNDIRSDFGQFNKEYPIIFSTTHSIKKNLNKDYYFDYIIMDEASQVDLVTGALALSCAKNAVIVGDLKQLPNVITSENKSLVEGISKKYDISDNYNYLKNSFLSSLSCTLEKAPRTLLREHYRCHPKIIQFCNKKFYNDELIIMTEDKGEDDVIKVYLTNKGSHSIGHVNCRQIDVIEKEVLDELKKKVESKNIGVISPYKDQKEEVDRRLGGELKVDTVHKFQGREEEAIIITTVDNQISEFVDDPRMLNVAITRAKRYLRLIVSSNEQNKDTNIDDLIKYIQYNNFEIVESKVRSIYDLLYKENREKRMEYLKHKKKISQYDSENLTYHLILDILQENGYNSLDVTVRIPLVDILSDINLLSEEEKRYVNNEFTHIDFVIFSKMDKKMVIAIEVDGYNNHKEGTRQHERDIMKNNILKKYDIPLLRFGTKESGEKEILEMKIKEVFSGKV